MKMQAFQSFGGSLDENSSSLMNTLNKIMMEIEQVVAPRREKYSLSANQLAHYQNEHKSRFIE
jgi:hypothetical protein